jgi:hypothetical protein
MAANGKFRAAGRWEWEKIINDSEMDGVTRHILLQTLSEFYILQDSSGVSHQK